MITATTVNPLITPVTVAYAAGLFDGEGHVSIAYTENIRKTGPKAGYPWRQWRVHVGMQQTAEATIEFMRRTFGGNVRRVEKPNKLAKKPQFIWELSNPAAVIAFAKLVGPICLIKRRQLEIAVEFLEGFRNVNWAGGRRDKSAELMRRRALKRAMEESRILVS